MILCENGPGGRFVRFDPRAVVTAHSAAEVAPALARLDAARAAGAWVAGWIAYEAGYALEPRLAGLMPPGAGPLLAFGICDAPVAAGIPEAAGSMTAPEPLVTRAAYDAAFARVADYIAAGDCYQINLTFPMAARLTGSPLGLYATLRARQVVGHGGYADFGPDLPVVISRSPELFFRTEASGRIVARPMKGTAPRHSDPVQDSALARELFESEKARAENLMIVDLLRNDIGRISQIGSVTVPELFAVESFATLHQMSSTVEGRLAEPAALSRLMPALFPCGSVTGAPKIRAMEIIRDLEPHPRGVYCGAFGWMGPEGDSSFNVTIRTLSVTGDRIVMNVGGGVVQDSTAPGEWEEALWKARFAMPGM
ncbi:MAG: aminodeoxychorismate synthase component I [Pseudorhodobacter sp.]